MPKLALGRIAFINVLPVYYALEHGIVQHPYRLVYGSPAELNDQMKNGDLAISSCSCMEYARRWRNYYLAPDLCIASHGPVMSVLLLSRGEDASELPEMDNLAPGAYTLTFKVDERDVTASYPFVVRPEEYKTPWDEDIWSEELPVVEPDEEEPESLD